MKLLAHPKYLENNNKIVKWQSGIKEANCLLARRFPNAEQFLKAISIILINAVVI